MRVPSDAQAAVLALIEGHAEQGAAVEWDTNPEQDSYRRSAARLYVEQIDRVNDTGRLEPADGHTYAHRVVSVRACVAHGWLSDLHKRQIHAPRTQWTREHVFELSQLDFTEDGVIALGLWRHRKLNAPQKPAPVLAGREYEAVALADRAIRLGYRLVPVSNDARDEARRLKRQGWVTRGFVGAHATSIYPSAAGVVEVNPEAADVPAA